VDVATDVCGSPVAFVNHDRCAVHRPEQPTDATAQLPEPEVPDILPEAEPWMPPR